MVTSRMLRVSQRSLQFARKVEPALVRRKSSVHGRSTQDGKELAERDGQAKKPSLIDQLFPEESVRYEATRKQRDREVPHFPLDLNHRPPIPTPSSGDAFPKKMNAGLRPYRDDGSYTHVLRLMNASKNLTLDDFRRVVPRGKHLPGWALEHGDIVKVIPGRNLSALAYGNYYYLLFSSPASAFMYRNHVARVHELVQHYTPSAIHMPPPLSPGYALDGVEISTVVAAYTLVSPEQKLQLMHLKLPLTPHGRHIVEHGGFESLLSRPERMPFELRLALDGPQLSQTRIRQAFGNSSIDRGLGWSGGDDNFVRVSKWEAKHRDLNIDLSDENRRGTNSEEETRERSWRMPAPVYILGFHTEHAAQSFLRYWHKRPLVDASDMPDEVSADLPPIVELEVLW